MKGAVAVLLLLALVGTASPLAPVLDKSKGWRQGRATFYGGSHRYLRNFPKRGPPPEYGFGTPLYGSCGYLSQKGSEQIDFASIPFPVDMLAAVANVNDDYPGNCGRCYEIKCDTGVVIGNYTGTDNTPAPYSFSKIYQEPGLNYSTLLDEYNRTWGGVWPNPLQSQDVQRTQCWNADQSLGLTSQRSNSIYVHVTDNCPCLQVDGGSTTITGVNPPCCGNVNHFDLSYWAFQKIAHPAWGLMNIQFRPVDCNTKVPLAYLPGFINETIYSDKIEAGWAWYPYKQDNKQLQVEGAGVGGSTATCIDVRPQGGLSFVSRSAERSGYRPFLNQNATTLSFYVKRTSAADIGRGSGVPSGVTVSIGNSDEKYYCQGLELSSLPVGATSNGLTQLTVPLSKFNCDLARVQQLGFQVTGGSSVQFCLDEIALTGGSPADPHLYSSV